MAKNRIVFFVMIFVLGAALRIGYFGINHYNMDIDGDEPWSKINLALRWMQSDSLVPDLNFGPLHTYLISSLRLLSAGDFIILSRLISLVFGILFLVLYGCLVSDIFGVGVALVSVFLLSIYPLHIHLSSVSLAEVPAVFFFFSSVYFLNTLRKKENVFYIICAAISLNLCCMLRFEYWISVFLFTGILVARQTKHKYVSVFFLLASFFPIIWLALNYRYTGNPLSFVTVAARVASQQMGNIDLFRRGLGFFKTIGWSLTLPVFIASIGGVVVTLRKSSLNNIFLLSFFLLFILVELRSVLGTYAYYITRYSLPLGLLLIPFAGVFLEYAMRVHLSSKYRDVKFTIAAIFMLICLASSGMVLRTFFQRTRVPVSLTDLVAWIKSNAKNTDKLLLECGVQHPFIVVNSGLRPFQAMVYDHLGVIQGRESIHGYIKEADYVVVCKKSGKFRDLVPVSSERARVFTNNDWEVYRKIKRQ